MAAGDKLKGDEKMLYAWDGLAYRPIACITSNELSSSAEVKESKNKCNPGVTSVEYSSINKSVSIEGEALDTTTAGGDSAKASFDFLEDAQDSQEKLDIKLDTGLEDAGSKFATVIIQDLTETAAAGEIVTFSATLNFDGGYKADPHA